MIEKAEHTLCANHTVQSQQLYQEVVKSAYQDCLDIALRISREMVGEICARDAENIAMRIQEALQHLSEAEVVRIEVATEREPTLKAALFGLGLKLCVVAKEQMPPGSAMIISKSGSVEVAWQDDFEELASTIRAAFERRQAQEKNGESL
jgi:flagellar biosynthesis/type III secretory pathway protein FliH